jgi:hypothetical protein
VRRRPKASAVKIGFWQLSAVVFSDARAALIDMPQAHLGEIAQG